MELATSNFFFFLLIRAESVTKVGMSKMGSLLAVAVPLLLLGCGTDVKSELNESESALYRKFVEPDVSQVDEQAFAELLEIRKQLTAGGAASKMSIPEIEKVTAQIEAMIQRLVTEIPSTTDERERRRKMMESRELNASIGRSGV